MKKTYMKPQTTAVCINISSNLMAASDYGKSSEESLGGEDSWSKSNDDDDEEW